MIASTGRHVTAMAALCTCKLRKTVDGSQATRKGAARATTPWGYQERYTCWRTTMSHNELTKHFDELQIMRSRAEDAMGGNLERV